ncbi:MAG: hypothetical protein CL477_05410 [Acidobacteria bacterium]|nr:hypothetical protein [Acidobacteriota bacterium]MDP7480690.1 YihY/virulence factor BrkB family protein [Vicinamibacterales bacterium]MDP7691437.1 YihY/virulence factor BrkB family protein [Vicinamibacterales bacterium]HJN43217.1 YihY/virulence factor BrkB family protein [Vicinamibacterales bacterium]
MSASGRSLPPGGVARRMRLALDRCGRQVGRDSRHAGRAAWLALQRLGQSDDLTFASSIAYYSLLSLFPLLLLLFSFLGRVTTDPADRTALIDLVLQYFPQRVDFITTQLDEVQGASLGLGVVGSLVIIWTALGVFRAISSAVNHAWNVDTRHSFLKHQASAFLMMLAAGVMLLAALLLVSLGEMMATSWFGRLLDEAPGLTQVTDMALRYPATLLLIVVVALILYFVPNTTVRVGDVWLGAVLTGVLWRLALDAFSWFLSLGALSVQGSVTAIVVFLLWVYISAVILIYGVEFSAAFARLRSE